MDFNIRHEKYIVAFHNSYVGADVQSIEEIPKRCLEIIGEMPLMELKRPFVVHALRTGKSTRTCMRIYDLSERAVRAIGRRVGLRK